MNIRELSHNLQNIYQEMSQTFSAYQTKTGWNCTVGCGKCCENPDVEASVLEMLPMAFKIHDQGQLLEMMDLLSTTSESYCVSLIPGSSKGMGKCGMYEQRPSVCRMFGVAGYFDKNHNITLSICREIREQHDIKTVPTNLIHDEVPMIAEWALKMGSIHPDLMNEKLPLNQALMKALEKVAMFSQYEEQDS